MIFYRPVFLRAQHGYLIVERTRKVFQVILTFSEVAPETCSRTRGIQNRLVVNTKRVSPALAPDAIIYPCYGGWNPVSEIIHWSVTAANSVNTGTLQSLLPFRLSLV